MNGKVIDIKGASKDAGAQVIMWSKGSKESKNQKWYFDQQGFIRSALTDMVFTAPSRSNMDDICRPIFVNWPKVTS